MLQSHAYMSGSAGEAAPASATNAAGTQLLVESFRRESGLTGVAASFPKNQFIGNPSKAKFLYLAFLPAAWCRF
jgi:hypothetical protein